jgi:hypothetical protein
MIEKSKASKHTVKRIGHTKYITAAEASEIIGVNQVTFHNWVKRHVFDNYLTVQKFGARQYYGVMSVRKIAKEFAKELKTTEMHA